MSYQIDVEQEVAVEDRIVEALKKAAAFSLQVGAIEDAAVTLLLTEDLRMTQLNQQFRGIEGTTDVLSFPAGEEFPVVADAVPYLGDIAISIPTADRQAQARGHDLAAELQLLVVHGVLHLLGYNHLEVEDKVQMWSIQDGVLTSLGLSGISPTEY